MKSARDDPTKKYYKVNFVVTYDVKNKEDLNHREYFSGATQFVQRDGSLSAPSCWFAGAKNQIAHLWELVAKHKAKNPDELSLQEFISVLRAKPKVRIEYRDVVTDVEKYKVKKNFIAEIVPV